MSTIPIVPIPQLEASVQPRFMVPVKTKKLLENATLGANQGHERSEFILTLDTPEYPQILLFGGLKSDRLLPARTRFGAEPQSFNLLTQKGG